MVTDEKKRPSRHPSLLEVRVAGGNDMGDVSELGNDNARSCSTLVQHGHIRTAVVAAAAARSSYTFDAIATIVVFSPYYFFHLIKIRVRSTFYTNFNARLPNSSSSFTFKLGFLITCYPVSYWGPVLYCHANTVVTGQTVGSSDTAVQSCFFNTQY